MKWEHKHYISGKLRAEDARHVPKELRGLKKSEAGCVELDDGSKFELVNKFCYLGIEDM